MSVFVNSSILFSTVSVGGDAVCRMFSQLILALAVSVVASDEFPLHSWLPPVRCSRY